MFYKTAQLYIHFVISFKININIFPEMIKKGKSKVPSISTSFRVHLQQCCEDATFY